MILILVSSYQKEAATFVKKFPEGAVSLLTCADLAEAATNLFYPAFGDSSITIGGATVPVSAITGVANLLPLILPEELYFFAEEERDYQSAEFRALLTFFLDALPCPVINRPSGSGLTGPFNHPIRWIDLARELSIPTVPLDIDSHDNANRPAASKAPPFLEITCFNQEILRRSAVFSATLPDLPGADRSPEAEAFSEAEQYTLQLAQHSGSAFLRVSFEMVGKTISLARASLLPDIRDGELMQCIANHLQKESVT